MRRNLAVVGLSLVGWGALITPVHAQSRSLGIAIAGVPSREAPVPLRVATPADGHLLLLNVRSGGDIRVLFPAKPGTSGYLSAGEYDLDRLNAPNVTLKQYGRKTIVAVWSASPLQLEKFTRYGHWAVSDVDQAAFRRDPVDATRALMRRLGGHDLIVASVEQESPPRGMALQYTSRRMPGDDVPADGRALVNCPRGSLPEGAVREAGCFVPGFYEPFQPPIGPSSDREIQRAQPPPPPAPVTAPPPPRQEPASRGRRPL
jgi:hypothetical protein